MAFNRKQENIIAQFRGLPGANPKARLRNTHTMEDLLGGLLKKHKLLEPRLEAVLMPQWGYVMGEVNAHRCAPQRIENTTLRVACAHPVLVRELQFNKKMILRRLQNVCPTLTDIKFVVG